MSENTADQLNRIQVPGKATNVALEPKPTKQLFTDLKVQKAYDIQSLSRDGGPAQLSALRASDLRDQVVELEFENGEKLWVKGDRLSPSARFPQLDRERSGDDNQHHQPYEPATSAAAFRVLPRCDGTGQGHSPLRRSRSRF